MFVCEKLLALAPVITIEVIASAPLPVLSITTGVAGDVVLTAWLVKVTDAGLKFTDTLVPVPDSVVICGDPGPSSVQTIEPLAAIAVCGVKVTLIPHVAPAARVNGGVPHPELLIAK